jgi:predicted TIM-barrel fold metal-dependent hydrolase
MSQSQLPSIDVHHHSFPPAYAEYLDRASQNAGGWFIEPWTLQTACDFCQSKSIGVAILSCIPGGPHNDVDLAHAQDFTGRCNDYNAQLVRDSLHSFGFFAQVTNLCEIDLTLKEIEYVFDRLGADGIALGTSYHKDGQLRYLGDSLFIPVWEALDARNAVVFIHPAPSLNIARINRNLPPPAFEFPHETGRTTIDMITNPSNMLRDHAANCKIILSHAGGDLPYLIDRIAGLMCLGPTPLRLQKSSEEVLAEARRFYYDTALSCSPMQLNAVASLLGPDTDHLLFGTDFPPAGVGAIDYYSAQLLESRTVNFNDLRSNALKLFPRLQKH